MYLIKADGSRVQFKRQRIIFTCRRVGISLLEAQRISRVVENQVRNGDTTKKVYRLILRELKKVHSVHHVKYRLREALSLIEPHLFEQYITHVLQSRGYEVEWNVLIKGNSVRHQVDIVAKKAGKVFLIECKHHHNFHRETGLGKVLQVQARLEDIDDGYGEHRNNYDFTQAWMITNTSFSQHARQYARAKKIQLTGWDLGKNNLRGMMDRVELHPITVLQTSANKRQLFKVMEKGVLTLGDFLIHKEKVLGVLDGYYYNTLLRKVREVLK